MAHHQVTCFSDSEEKAVGKDHLVQFLPESRLRELGGLYEKVCKCSIAEVMQDRLSPALFMRMLLCAGARLAAICNRGSGRSDQADHGTEPPSKQSVGFPEDCEGCQQSAVMWVCISRVNACPV